MVPAIRRFLLYLAFAGCVQGELRFTFQSQESELDGVKLRQLVFSDGTKQVSYAPPRGWQYFGGDDRLRLLPPAGQPGEAIISRTKLAQPQVFDDATLKRLTDEVVASVPKGTKRVSVILREKNRLLIDQKETFLVVINFELYGTPQSRSVMFLNRPGEQIQFQLTCPQARFPDLQKQFLGSQFTWQNL